SLSAHPPGTRRIALGMLLDQPFEQAYRESDAGRLDRLQVDRRQQVAQEVRERSQAVAGGIAGERDGIGRIAEVGHRGRRRRGDVVDAIGAQCDDAGPGWLSPPPDPANQGSVGAVFRQDVAGRSWHWTSPFPRSLSNIVPFIAAPADYGPAHCGPVWSISASMPAASQLLSQP